MSSTYAWVITENNTELYNEENSIVGIRGPSSCHLTKDEIVNHSEAKKFRLVDDDDIVYCGGYFVDLAGNASGFEPKDNFGEPELGCTTIQYYEDGVWKSL